MSMLDYESVRHSSYRRRQTVRSLTVAELDDMSSDLYRRFAGGVTHVVGIASAGDHIARSIVAAQNGHVVRLTIVARRSTTSLKRRLHVSRFLTLLPESVTNELRRFENRLLTSRLSTSRAVEMPSGDAAELRRLTGRRDVGVLVVDDCVDTGGSLKAALDFVVSLTGPGVPVYSAVLCQTIEHPVVIPDVCLYPNTQFRGPWSYDR